MTHAARAEKIKIDKPAKTDSVHMRADHAMPGDVGDDVHLMVHGKIQGVHDDEYGRRVEIKMHKIEHQKKGGSK